MSAVTGYFDTVFAREVYADTVCVKKSDGTSVCLNGDQVENVLNATNVPLLQISAVSGTSTDSSSDSTTSSSTTDIVVVTPTEDQTSSSTQEVDAETVTTETEPVIPVEVNNTEIIENQPSGYRDRIRSDTLCST